MFETEQANTEIHELCRQMIVRIEKFGTLEGFADSDLMEMLKTMKELLEPLPSLIEVVAPVVVFGDIHGQLADLMQLKSRAHAECERGIVVDLLWSDPNRKEDKCQFNKIRGISNVFGKSAVDDVCNALDIDLIIRAHELKENGHEFEFDNRLLTVFSAPYYSGNNANCGSVVTISRSLKLQIVTLKPAKGHDSMKLDKQTMHDFEANFQPLNEDPAKTLTCQYNFPQDRTKMGPYLGKYSMFAHETKNCIKANEEPLKPLVCVRPAEENTALAAIRKTMKGYGLAISLKDESMSLESIRRKLGTSDIKDKLAPPPPVKTPTPEGPPPPSPPSIPPSPPSSAESA
ncbi:Protein CBG21717 [Caenorhabditis briggsae]|uniref:Protein CBG21717 n=1 Tax=Caenorhabditis briggsae TaxID=6238 RepID=A8Y0N1_CAEBR|nr:Protein CBG21717 [Caenorhabditis briggsae]CAP38451.2 Protein CBG21717 [Caenorhabditis briggsae]